MKMSVFLKGVCYAPFPNGYTASTANQSLIWFGSDMAERNKRPLWGDTFSPVDGPDKGAVFTGRNDIKNLSDMGVNLIRLYDWDPRNIHVDFLDYCVKNNIKVLVTVSNWNFESGNNPENIALFQKSLLTAAGGYHPAIYGILFANEPDLNGITADMLLSFMQMWVQLEKKALSINDGLLPMVGVPTSFAKNNPQQYPCWEYWDRLLPGMRELFGNKRVMLCPQTYNTGDYLYKDAGSGKGWVELTYDRYQFPVLFCEIGQSRGDTPSYLQMIEGQLSQSMSYAKNNPGKLLGLCFFQYCDKVWVTNKSEGEFGVVANTEATLTPNPNNGVVHYGDGDFTHWDVTNIGSLPIQVLTKNQATFDIVSKYYKST